MAKITVPETKDLMALLREVTDWKDVEFEESGLRGRLQRNPHDLGRQFAAFLNNGGRVTAPPTTIVIPRPTLFDPTEFLEKEGWTVLAEAGDQRASLTEEINLSRIRFVTMLNCGEKVISGAERLRRIKDAGHIRLDVGVFLYFLKNQHLIPDHWKENPDGSECCIYFDGTILQSPHGEQCAFCLYWHDDRWSHTLDWLERECEDSVSAVIHLHKAI